MFGKLGSFITLLRMGEEVADVEKWKSRQITGTVVAGLIIAIINVAKAYGYELPVSTDDANSLGLGIIAVANIVLTATTSKRAGLLPARVDPTAVQPEVSSPAVDQAGVPPVDQPDARPLKADDRDIYIG